MKRNPEIELLRIIAMFMVLMLHSLGHGGVLDSYDRGTLGYCLFWSFEAFCFVAVNCFVLITGYFGAKSKFRISRLLTFWFEVLTFSLICTAIVFNWNKGSLESVDWKTGLLPITSKSYWFASVYLLLLLFKPLLNEILEKMNKTSLIATILTVLVVYSIIPSFMSWSMELVGSGMDLVWFSIMYLIGGFIGKYGARNGKARWLAYYALFTGITFLMRFLDLKDLYFYNSATVLCASICLFMFIINLSKLGSESNRLLNFISVVGKYVFGAYLISDNRVIREFLWDRVNIVGYCQDNILKTLCYITFVNICIFTVGTIIDWLIKRLLSIRIIRNSMTKVDEGYTRFVSYIERKGTNGL